MGVLQTFLDFLYSSTCVSCNELLADDEQHICARCWGSIPRITEDHPLFQSTRSRLLNEGGLLDLHSVFIFEKDGAFQSLVHLLKYDGFRSAGVRLGEELGRVLNERNVRADAVVPVPLHKAKRRERGFNQAEAIAEGVSAVTGIPARPDLLVRKKNTATQTMLSLEERERNVRGAFALNEDRITEIEGRRILLVDDVITTGSTIAACDHELRKGGVSAVVAAAAALAE